MAKQQKLVTPAAPAPPRYTQAQIEHAAADARLLIGESKVLQACLTADIASRRLYMLIRQQIDNEIEHGWEVDCGELIVQTLVMSAQEKATEQFTVAGLLADMRTTVLPFLELLEQIERDNGSQAPTGADQVDRSGPAGEPYTTTAGSDPATGESLVGRDS